MIGCLHVTEAAVSVHQLNEKGVSATGRETLEVVSDIAR
ncbi:hypothetical protein ALP40_200006 [Pseudomonas viridiflava]|uniref:Uncharacterized protein n=1 Tax=Pseudomonas viridiflava TaxID=33069 RepID=A0A3M5P3J8_PSEVI|nr:hypothetical protein ALP40_200006 [Pseudomonas viridiflava]